MVRTCSWTVPLKMLELLMIWNIMSRAVVGADGRGDDGIGLTMSLAISAPYPREDK